MTENPSIVADMPAEEYHAAPAMSSGALKQMLRSPAHYQAWLTEPRIVTDAMRFGTLVHCAILEPDKLESCIVMVPDDAPDRRSKAGKEWWVEFDAAATRERRIKVRPEDMRKLEGLRQSAHDSPSVQVLLSECEYEQSLSWSDDGVPCKARLDALSVDRHRIVDLKTTADAGADMFARSIHRYAYHVQAGFYRRGVYAHSMRMPEWYWLAIETDPPYAIAAYRAPAKMLTRADDLIEGALATYRKCVAENYWPGYDPTIRDIDLPAWSYREQSDAEQL